MAVLQGRRVGAWWSSCCRRCDSSSGGCHAAAFAAPPPAKARPAIAAAAAAAASKAAAKAAPAQAPQQPQQPQCKPASPQSPPLAQYLDFELLWLRARARLSLSRAATSWALADVRAGVLPPDAAALEARAAGVLKLGERVPGADGRALVNRHRLGLRHDAGDIEAPMRQLLALALPPAPGQAAMAATTTAAAATQLLLAALPELTRRAPEEVALAALAVGPVMQEALGAGSGGGIIGITGSGSTAVASRLMGPLLAVLLRDADAANSDSSSKQGAAAGVAAAAPRLTARLLDLTGLLGPELATDAVAADPSLLDATPAEVAARAEALGALLERPAYDAAAAAGRHAALLAAPAGAVAAAGGALIDGLQQWFGWPRRGALHFLAWNPGVLAAAVAEARRFATTDEGGSSDSSSIESSSSSAYNAGAAHVAALMGAQVEAMRTAAASRRSWSAALARPRYALAAAVLCGGSGTLVNPGGWLDGQARRLERARYTAASGDLPRLGLRRVLAMHEVEFLAKCPGFRRWRLVEGAQQQQPKQQQQLPPSWWLVEPQIEILGELGPYDRL